MTPTRESLTPEERIELARELWGWAPHDGQREFLTLRLPDGAEPGVLVAACGRRWGKTNALAVDCAVRVLTEPGLSQLVVGPTRDQAEGLFDEIASLLEEAREDEGLVGRFPVLAKLEVRRSPYPHIRRKGPGAPMVLSARSAGRNGRNLRGKGTTRKAQNFRVVADEAGFIPDVAIEEAILPMLATVPGGGQLVMISSPAGRRGAFYRALVRGEQGHPGHRAVRLPSEQNPLVDRAFLERMREDMTERRFRAEFLAEFVESAGAVFREDEILAATVADDESLERGPLPGARYVAGVDFGRRGDFTVAFVACVDAVGARVVAMLRLRGLSWKEQVARVADLLTFWGCRSAFVDRTGVGDAVAESLSDALLVRKSRCAVGEYVFTAVSKRESLDALSLALSGRRVCFPGWPDLISELRLFEVVSVSATGSERMAASEGHDDCVMALALLVQAAQEYLTPGGWVRPEAATGGSRESALSRRFVGQVGGREKDDFNTGKNVPWMGEGEKWTGGIRKPGVGGAKARFVGRNLPLWPHLTSAYRSGAVRRAVEALQALLRRRRGTGRRKGIPPAG